MSENTERKYRHNRKLLLRCAAGFLVVAFVTLLAQSFCNNVFSSRNIAQGEEFTDYDSFKAYMEQPLEYDGYDSGSVAVAPDDTVYYDVDGNEISEEEFYREDVTVYDGSPEGKTVCTFIWRNRTVIFYRTADSEDGLPIAAITYGNNRAANRIVDAYNIGFGVLYCLELLGTAIIYLRKRMK